MNFFRLAVAVACLCSTTAFSQKVRFINPSEVIKESSALYDSGKYEECVKLLTSIPERDTAHVQTLSKLAYSYIDLKEYDKALAICEGRINSVHTSRALFMKIRGIAMGRKGQYADAVKAYEEGIRQYPTDVSMQYSFALLHYNNKEYKKAEDLFFKILQVNPFFTGCHLNLARISIVQGRKVHAMLAMGLYLAINVTDNSNLILLNNLVDNQVTDEGTVAPFGANAFSKLDQIIKARMTSEEGYESKYPVKAPVVQQYELLFDQLASTPVNTEDPYAVHYLPAYKAIMASGNSEAFIYHILTSTKIEAATKWRSKNEKQLKAFFEVTNQSMRKVRDVVTIESLGVKSAPAWYNNTNQLTSIGRMESDKRLGPWLFFFSNGERQAEGMYNDAGVKSGVWKYYYDNGKVKSVENYENGEVTVFSEKGNKGEYFFLKDNAIHGDVTLYYDNGPIKEKLKFAAGKRHGGRDLFFGDGTLKARYEYVDSKVQGPYFINFENGKLKERCGYHDGQLHGKYEFYYANGAPRITGEFANGSETGTWKYFYRNGKVQRTGSYTEKGGVGEWNYFNERGEVTEKRNFDSEGRYHGDVTYYDNGKVFAVSTYKKDILVKETFFDSNGKVTLSSGSNDGTFYSKNLLPDGTLKSEGNYIKGKANGPWKFYNRYGVLTAEYNYKDDKLEGKAVDYHPTGKKKIEATYSDGKLDGYYQEFYPNGNVKDEGWYKEGNREQQWLTYYSNGTLESDFYYLQNRNIGKGYNYSVDGKPYSVIELDQEGNILNLEYFNSGGASTMKKRTENFSEVYEEFYGNKKPKSRSDVLCGNYHRSWDRYLPDGSLFYKYSIVNGKKNGTHVYHEVNGNVSTTGQYEDDERQGYWKSYHENGKLYSEGNFLSNQRDSIWTYYYDNGTMSSRGPYLRDKRDGVFMYYGLDGTPLVEKMFDEGELIAYRSLTTPQKEEWVRFNGSGKISIRYANGNPAMEEEYKNGLQQSYYRIYYPTGKVFRESQYVDDDLSGTYTLFHANGKVSLRGVYKDDDRHGKWEKFAEDGTPEYTEHYVMGYRNGPVVLYKKGVKEKEFTFWNSFAEN
jgi:uncharacterized protein